MLVEKKRQKAILKKKSSGYLEKRSKKWFGRRNTFPFGQTPPGRAKIGEFGLYKVKLTDINSIQTPLRQNIS